jgi:hypothetical protein
MKKQAMPQLLVVCALVVLASTGCTTRKQTAATANVAVTQEAVSNATDADGVQFAPSEMAAAREKLARAREALTAKDYKTANALATEAQADAKLAQSKANSAKAQAVSDALQSDIRVLRDELDRANTVK